MAIIKKTITGLKPDTNYIFSLKPKNVEIAAADTLSETLRISIPAYSVSPSLIQNAGMKSFFETVMIYFDPINDLDLDSYEYEIYDNALGTGTPVASGKNKANVFTVAVPNTTDSQQKQYWARVRTVNTSGGVSNYTNLFTDFATPQIGSQYIASLTAAKITAGTIGAHTITLAGATSIIKSSTYNATQGWQIDGQGNATFNTATIRGELSSGTSPNWFRVDTSGNIWSGADTFTNAASKFRVSNAGVLTAASGTVGGVSMASNKLYIGTGTYANTNTSFYVDNTGQFSLKDKLTWNNTDLNINGTITVGTFDASSGSVGLRISSSGYIQGSGGGIYIKDFDGTGVTRLLGNIVDTEYVRAEFYEPQVGESSMYFGIGGTSFNVNGNEILYNLTSTRSRRYVGVTDLWTLVSLAAYSSIRYKENIKDLDIDYKKILNIQPVSFYYKKEFLPKDDPCNIQFGAIAEQVHELGLIDLVDYNSDGKPETIKYDLLPIYLLKVCQEQEKVINNLSSKVDELESRLL